MTVYLILSWRYISNQKLYADKRTYHWAKQLLSSIGAIVMVWLVFLIFFFSPFKDDMLNLLRYYPLYVGVVVLIYYLSTRLMVANFIFRTNPHTISELIELSNQIKKVLVSEKLYQDTNLSLESLSKQTGIPKKSISFVLNHYEQKGFNQYLNELRVRAALHEMKLGKHKRFSLEGIAMQVGFASRATFSRAFKEITGTSPSEYINS